MFIYFLFIATGANDCQKECIRPCFFNEIPDQCLQDCGCPSDPQLYVWNCSWAFISACEYSTNFTECMYENNCAVELPHGRKLTEKNSKSLEGIERLVECSDCKIFQGDDYWECVSEYCVDKKIGTINRIYRCYEGCLKNCKDCEEECETECGEKSENLGVWVFAIFCGVLVAGLCLISKQRNRGYMLVRE